MARKYRTYKFTYTDDFNRNIIKRQRVYLDDSLEPITPITQLFLDRVIDFEEKVTGTSQGIRSLLTYIGIGKFEVKLPYKDTINLIAHIEEVLAVERVECADYRGERIITGGIENNLQQQP